MVFGTVQLATPGFEKFNLGIFMWLGLSEEILVVNPGVANCFGLSRLTMVVSLQTRWKHLLQLRLTVVVSLQTQGKQLLQL